MLVDRQRKKPMNKRQSMRFRKDLGDLTDLKKSIKENGLIHPVVVDSKGNLIAGERRSAACKELGIEPEYRVVDFDDPQQAEIDENTCRKDFTPREIYEIAQHYNEKHSRQGKKNDSNGNGDFVQNPNEVKKPIENAAKVTGKSVDTISKLNQIFESKYESIKQGLDSNKVSINEAYEQVKHKEKQETERIELEARRADFCKYLADPQRVREREGRDRLEEEFRQQREQKEKKQRVIALQIIDLGYEAAEKHLYTVVGATTEDLRELQEVKEILIARVEYRFQQ